MKHSRGFRGFRGFSLIELLVVMAIIGTMMALSGPVVTALSGSGSVNKAIVDISGAIESARGYAMSRHTYVRLALAEALPAEGRGNRVLVVLTIAPRSGTLDTDGGSDMADAAKWTAVSKPLMIDNLALNDALGAATDDLPSDSNIAKFSRRASGMGTVSFTSFIQINPAGELGVSSLETSRHIKIGLSRPPAQNDKNPFVIRISGTNGSLSVLRAGSGI